MHDNDYHLDHNATRWAELTATKKSVGVIVIGRNEGERLHRAFASLPLGDVAVLYVDSGSTDGSIELARALGIKTHCLDPARPFSPARGRAEGVTLLQSAVPDLRFVQFLDGDCELAPDWLARAAACLEQRPEIGIVCGMVSEAAPEASVYNRLSPQRWKLKVGKIESCGGIFMIRLQVYEAVGGFNQALITREESDLCMRVRAAGHLVVRLDTLMAKHDSGLLRFSQWWRRAVWGGYGDALGIDADSGNIENRRRLRWYLSGPLANPVLIMAGLVGVFWSPWFLIALLLGIAALGLQFARIFVARLRQGDHLWDAVQFSAFTILRNLACGVGFLQYFLNGKRQAKRPDPHAPQK